MSTEVAPVKETQEQIWDRNWMEYGAMMVGMWRSGTLSYESLSKVKSFRNCLCQTYSVMLKFEMVEKLENCLQSLKEEMWQIAKEHKGEMTKQDMIQFCKCILVIENLL